MQKIIIVGATSGIGRGLAELYAKEDCVIGTVGRRENLLIELYSINKDKFVYKIGDVSKSTIIDSLDSLYKELDGLDLFIICAGTGELNTDLDYDLEKSTIDTNILGFTNIVDWAYHVFAKQNKGHLVIISSIGGLRGSCVAPAYNASKAYQINYFEGLRCKVFKEKRSIYLTDIRPGFVDTVMAKGDGLFWVVPKQKAVDQIYKAVEKKKKIAYISKRWRYIGMLLKILPSSIYSKM